MTQAPPSELKSLTKQFRQPLAKLLLARLLSSACQLTAFWFFAMMMHRLIVDNSDIEQAIWYGFITLALAWVALRQLAIVLEGGLSHAVEQHLQSTLHRRLRQRQHALAKQYSSFDWQQIFLNHIPAIGLFISQYSTQKYLSALLPLMVLALLSGVNWLITLALIVTLPLIPVFMILVGYQAADIHRRHLVSLSRLGGLFVDRLKALTLLTSFNQHQPQAELLNQASRVVNRQTMSVVGVAFLSTTVLDFFATVAMALVAVYIGFSLLGEIAIGPALSFQTGLFILLLAPLLFTELKTLGRLYHQKAKAEAAMDLLSGMLTMPEVSGQTLPFTGINWLNFQTNGPNLHAEKLPLHRADKVLLTGQSGAGKTALLEALMGLKTASHHLQSKCLYLGQKPVLLPGSVRANLCLDQPQTDQQLWRVLAQVQLDKKITRLPHGLDTPLGEYPPLSGGEAQRLALARVLLQPSEVLLLDEPTAHLSQEQHDTLAALINLLTEGKTVIWASHKPLPQDWFNRRWHIEDGEITAC